MKPKKIFIIGTTGSGKSVLSERLSKLSNIPRYDLDEIYYKQGFNEKEKSSTRKKKLLMILKREKWIIEGVYTSWTNEIFRKADLVIWLDLPSVILSWRIFKRYLKKKLKGECPKDETLKSTFNLIKFANKYKKSNNLNGYRKHQSMTNKYKVNFIKINNKKQLNEFLEGLK